METLKKNREFQRIYKKGLKVHSKYFMVFFNKNRNTTSKFGLVSSKKTGNAIRRNRIKRILREIIRKNIQLFNSSYDYVIVAKSLLKDENEISYNMLSDDMMKIIGKLKNEKTTNNDD